MPVESTEQQTIKTQYASSGNLEARIRLHQQFSTNPYGWFRWYVDQMDLRPGMTIVELGCGAGTLWQTQAERFPADAKLLLTDYSLGMASQAKHNLPAGRFHFASADVQTIPLPDSCADAVIANHMLYHVPNRDRATAEIRRVLKPGGKLYAATNGKNHLIEINLLSARLQGRSTEEETERINQWSAPFTLENGAEQLARHFASVRLLRYEDNLRVTQAQPLVDYLLSMHNNFQSEIPPERIRQLTQELEETIRAEGEIFIRKDAGIFIAE